jgi:hypothetical protein
VQQNQLEHTVSNVVQTIKENFAVLYKLIHEKEEQVTQDALMFKQNNQKDLQQK